MKSSPFSPESLDPYTQQDLESILEILLDNLPGDALPVSIVLSGGFARGESGHYSYDGRSLPFGDYDLDVVLERPLLDEEQRLIEDEIETRLSYRSVSANSEPTLVEDAKVHNVLDLRFKTREEFLQRAPDLAVYDLLGGYCVLFGEDVVRKLPPVGLEEISPFSPWRILGNRLVLGLKHVSIDFWERPPTRHETLALRLAICRTYLDLAGTIGFLHGGYQFSSAGRLEFLRENQGLWRTWVPDPEEFLSRVEYAREFKLHPKLETAKSAKIFAEWFDLVYDIGRVFPHLINLFLLTRRVPLSILTRTLNEAALEGKEAGVVSDPFREDWRTLVGRQIKLYPSLYYREFVKYYLRRKGRKLPLESFLCSQGSRYYGVMEHYLWRGRKWIVKNPRRSVLAPTAFQSAVLPLLLFSLSPKREVNLEALEAFDSLMNAYMLMPFDFLPPEKRWEATKRCFVHEMLDYRSKQ